MRMRSIGGGGGGCYWWPLFLICTTVLFPGVLNSCLLAINFFFLLMHVYAFLTVSTPGYGANKKERQTVM
jgi:hypothetical protein